MGEYTGLLPGGGGGGSGSSSSPQGRILLASGTSYMDWNDTPAGDDFGLGLNSGFQWFSNPVEMGQTDGPMLDAKIDFDIYPSVFIELELDITRNAAYAGNIQNPQIQMWDETDKRVAAAYLISRDNIQDYQAGGNVGKIYFPKTGGIHRLFFSGSANGASCVFIGRGNETSTHTGNYVQSFGFRIWSNSQ